MATVLSSVKYTPDGVPYHELTDFNPLQRLASGGDGIVYKGYSTVEKDGVRSKRTVAVKTFFQLNECSEREILILKTNSHLNVVEILGVIWDGNLYRVKGSSIEKPIYTGYVMEYMELGSLHKEIHDVSKTYNIGLAAIWIRQIGSGLQFLHKKRIIHRDIKPENILLAARDRLKLADFGQARNVSDDRITSNVGTQCYRAPEVLTSNNYDERADVFSFGVTIWEIFHRKRPWKYLNVGKEPIIDSAAMEGELSSLVKQCWQEASTRPSIEEITAFEPINPKIVIEKEGQIDETGVGNRSTSTWDTITVLSSVKYTPDGVPYHTLNDFQELKRLDGGGYGIVYKGYDVTRLTLNKRMVAVKVFYQLDVYAERQIQILKRHSHPHIVELFGVIWDGETKDMDGTLMPLYSGCVMEYMELGSLHNEIHDVSKQYDLKLIALWINQIGSGLQYLHEHEILHRNVKPKNILLATRTHLKLAGFGMARNISHQNTYTSGRIGTDPYMAPEIVEPEKNYGPPADVYSFGITIWEIICRKYPSEHLQDGNDCIELPIDSHKMSEDSWNFVKRCWQRNISDRPSIKEIINFAAKFVQTILVVGRQLKTAVLNQDEWLRLQIKVPQDGYLEGGAVCLNNEMYLVGEYSHHRGLYKLDKNNYNWIRLADMQVGRQWITNSCLEWNGYIWVFGGENEETGEYLNSVERYDPSGNEWITMPDMTYPRRAAAATVCNGKIYVCGGRTGQADRSNSVECFDLESGVWNELVALPIPLYGHSLVSYGHKLIVMGGYDGRAYSSTVLELDPLEENGQWRELAPMSHGCAYFAGLVLDEDIYVIGGRDETGYTSRVQIFNGNEWRDGPTLPSECSRPSAVVIPQPLAD